MVEQKTAFMAMAALAALVWLFRKGNSTATPTMRPATVSTLPAATGSTGTAPVIIVARPSVSAPADAVVSTPAPTPPVKSQGFTVGGVTTGRTAPEYLPTPATAVTADSPWDSQGAYDEYRRRSALPW